MATKTAEALRWGDLIAIGPRTYQVREIVRHHPASVRLAFHGWEHVTLRRETKLRVVGNEPLPPPKRKRGRSGGGFRRPAPAPS